MMAHETQSEHFLDFHNAGRETEGDFTPMRVGESIQLGKYAVEGGTGTAGNGKEHPLAAHAPGSDAAARQVV